jgi:hypothetical protein
MDVEQIIRIIILLTGMSKKEVMERINNLNIEDAKEFLSLAKLRF